MRAPGPSVNLPWRQWACGATLLVATAAANAALIDRGSGLIYDTVLDVTWLQNANFEATQNGCCNGQMTWEVAKTWVANLSYQDTVRNQTLTNWRLPSIAPLNGVSFQFGTSTAGNKDDGYNVSVPGTLYAGSTQSELAYMYYNNLGNIARCPTSGWNDCRTTPTQLKAGPFTNLLKAGYWFGSNESLPFAPPDAWAFDMGDLYGVQGGFNGNQRRGAWAVMDGDVTLVPEASSWAMFAAGLAGLAAVRARRRRQGTQARS